MSESFRSAVANRSSTDGDAEAAIDKAAMAKDESEVASMLRPPSGGRAGLRASVCDSIRGENRAAAFALAFLVFVAVSKTLLTKLVFNKINTPVAFSVISCLATNICLVPIILLSKNARFSLIARERLPLFAGICAAIAVDLGCTNVGISLLSVALQQCIKATSPAATLAVEAFWNRKCEHPVMILTVILLCCGPVLASLGSSSWDGSPYTLGGHFGPLSGVPSYTQ